MTLVFRGAVLALTLWLLPVAAHAEVRRALVIGIDKYAPNPRFQNLEGAVADAKAMAEFLRSTYDYEVVELMNEQATAAAIEAAFRKAFLEGPGGTEKGLGVFYFSGHGSRIKNSAARKAYGYDETIVPYDGKDIRSIDLGGWIAEASRPKEEASKQWSTPRTTWRMTVILDSCFSGGATRGGIAAEPVRSRAASADETDHPDSRERPDPVAAGALLLLASSPQQEAKETRIDGKWRGVFTSALLDALGTSARDASAEQVFARVHAIVKVPDRRQDPAIDGKDDRKSQPPLGPPVVSPAGKPVIAAGRVLGPDKLELMGGAAIGLAPGARLERPAQGKSPAVRVTVSEVNGPTRSIAVVASPADGSTETVKTGDPFEVVEWSNPAPTPLRVDVGAVLPFRQVQAVAQKAAALRSPKFDLVEDPARQVPTHEVFQQGTGFSLRGPGGSIQKFDGFPTREQVEAALASFKPTGRAAPSEPCVARPCLFVRIPFPEEMTSGLPWASAKSGASDPKRDPVVAVGPTEESDYALVGRTSAAGPEYALVMRGAAASGGSSSGSGLCSTRTPMPIRTDWIDTKPFAEGAGTPPDWKSRSARLEDYATQLAKLRAWLLVSGSGDRTFPFHLELRTRGKRVQPVADASGALVDPVVPADGKLEMWLVPDPERARGAFTSAYPYVISIDCRGALDVAYPAAGVAAVQFPEGDPPVKPAGPVRLGEVELDGTRGAYVFVLMTSTEPLRSIRQIELPPVQTRGTKGGPPEGTVESFLLDFGVTRAPRKQSPTIRWSTEQVGFVAGP